MLTPRENPLYWKKNSPQRKIEPMTLHQAGQRAQHTTNELYRPLDSIQQLDTAAQVTMFRLRSGHCQLLSHLHRLKISHSDECPCGTNLQPPLPPPPHTHSHTHTYHHHHHHHTLKSCPTFNALRGQSWPSPVDALPHEAPRSGENTAANYGLCLTRPTDNLA